MIHKLKISLAFLIWIFGCAGIIPKTVSNITPEFRNHWAPIISALNRDPGQTEEISHNVTIDLLRENQKELTQIQTNWNNLAKEKSSKSVSLQQENMHFYNEIEALNKNSVSHIKRSNLVNKKSYKNYRIIAQKILNMVDSDSVISSKVVDTYEQGEQIGFCFGRALAVHYLLIKAGVPQHDILKIFVLGDLLVEQQFWRFHMAVMVRDSASGFIVIDPLQTEPIAYEDWIAHNLRYEIKHPYSRARFYITDPRKFLPTSGIYDINSLSHPVFKDYFYSLGLKIASIGDKQ